VKVRPAFPWKGVWTPPWSPTPVAKTVSSFDLEQAPQAGGAFVGDDTGLTSSGNKFLALFVQAGTDGAGTSAAYSRWFGLFGSLGGTGAVLAGASAAAPADTTQVPIPIDPGNDGWLDPFTPAVGTPKKKVLPGV
jgi:hypothetical protein